MQPIEIFRPGKWTAMSGETLSFGQPELAASAAAYDPALHEAPIVVGHPRDDAPAYGWIEDLAFSDGALKAGPHQVDPAFAELVKAGRFKKVSASFYRPDAPNNPAPGAYYLRHVGFLGAQAPAVKGLKQIAFAEDEDGVLVFGDFSDRIAASLFSQLRDWIIDKFSLEDADKALPGFMVDDAQHEAVRQDTESAGFAEPPIPDPKPEEDPDVSKEQEQIAAKEAELKARQEVAEQEAAAFAEREKAHADRVAAFRASQAAAKVDALIDQGKVPPGHKAGLVAFMAALDDGETLEFAEAEGGEAKKTSPRAFFEAFLDALPKQIDFAERGGEGSDDLDRADPQAIANAAVAYQEEQRQKGLTVSTDAAVRHVIKQGA